jgi:hypothetical protein
MIPSFLHACVLTLSLSSLAACSSSGARPVLASSASQPACAMKYPDDLAATTKGIADRRAEGTQLSAGFAARVDELKKPDWDRVLAIVEKADEAGKSAGYADAQTEANSVRAFWNDERDAINAKVAGNANYAAKQGSCTADVGGAATFALKEAVDKQLEKRLRGRNDAYSIIDRYRVSLGKENAASLEKLADDVARASYVVHVDLLEQRERLRARVADKGAVAKTLDHFIEEERAFQAEAGRTDAEKKASEDRIAAAAKSRADLDRAATAAEESMKTIDAQIDAAQKEYDDALKALKAKIAEKKKTG